MPRIGFLLHGALNVMVACEVFGGWGSEEWA